MPDQVARRDRQRGLGWFLALIVATPHGFMRDFDVDITGRARHVARAHRLAPRHLHRFVKITRHFAGGRVFCVRANVMIFVLQGQSIGRAARQQYLISVHPARHLRQAHRISRQPGGVHRIADRQFRIVGHHFRRFGQRLFERICRIIGGFVHIASSNVIRPVASLASTSTWPSRASMTL